MEKLRVQIGGLMAAAAILLLSCEARAAAKTPPPRRLKAVRTKTAPKLDGRLDDPCWRQAAKATGFTRYGYSIAPNIPHPEQTIGRVCFDDENLYISMECQVSDVKRLKAQLLEIDKRVKSGLEKSRFMYSWGGVIEVFLDTNLDRKTFQQYLLHANSSSLCTLPTDDVFRILNEDYLQSASQITEKGFNIEMSFPLAMIHLRPDTSKVWGFNLNRAHDYVHISTDRNDAFSSWNSTRGRGFQNAELFGELVMDADFSPFYWRVDFVREPRAGDPNVQLRIKNETGRDFSGRVVLGLTPKTGKPSTYEKPLSLGSGAEVVIAFDHSISAADLEAKYEVRITDKSGKTRYLGGTQTVDVAKADPWAPPAPTKQQEKAGYIVFHRPYTQPVIYKAVPKADEVVKGLSVSACRGEFEPVTFSVFPLRNVPSLAVTAGPLTGPDGATIPASAVDVRKMVCHSNWKGVRAFETQELLLRRFDAIPLTRDVTQRFWLTVHVPKKAPAGEYRGTVHLTAAGATTELPMTVRVLPFELSKPDGMWYFMFDPGNYHESYRNPEFFKKTVEDQRDHGMTTWTIYSWSQQKDEKTGKFRIDVDNHVANNYGVTYARMMDILRAAGFGKDVPMFDLYSASFKTASVIELCKIYQDRGWGSPLIYVGDELETRDRIEPARRKLKQLKAAAPNIKTTTALGLRGLRELGHLYDVWSAGSVPAVQKAKSLGKACWNYSCRPQSETSPAFVRSFFGRYAWRLGLNGVALWDYHGYGCSFLDRFGRRYWPPRDATVKFRPEYKYTHGYVLFEDGRIIPTAAWEAVREGIDDYRYMLTLKKMAEAAIWDADPWTEHYYAGYRAAMAGFTLLDKIHAATDLSIVGNDKKYGRDWKAMGDMDADRSRIIEAILDIQAKAKQ